MLIQCELLSNVYRRKLSGCADLFVADLLAEGEESEEWVEPLLPHDQADQGLYRLPMAGLELGELLVLSHLPDTQPEVGTISTAALLRFRYTIFYFALSENPSFQKYYNTAYRSIKRTALPL